jgi:4-amino-4-deoxy-L-arabinose transferase-like glycosyltransferase
VPEPSRARFAGLLALLLLGTLALGLPSLGEAPLERAEIYFLDASRAMVESGDWVVPRYQGEPFFDKPPLTYWLMAGAFLGWGPEPGVARLVPLLAALGVMLATAWLGRLLFDRRTALAGSVVLSTTIAFLTFARVAMSDMLLTLWTTLAVALGVRVCRPQTPRWVMPALGAVLGLGFATKGPVALLVPGLALLLLLIEHRGRRPRVGLGSAAATIAALAVLGFGWYVLVFSRLGAGPLEYFFLRENLERFAGEAFDVGRPAWFYLPAYAAEGLPWSPLLPLALWRLLRRDSGDDEGRGPARFLVGWVGLVLVPLVLSRGKIDYYLLPLYPAVSLLIGRFFVGVPWRRLDRTWVRVVLLLLGGALAALVIRHPDVPVDWLPEPKALLLLAVAMGASGLGALAAATRPAPGRVLAVLAGGTAAAWAVLVVFFLPAFARAQPNRAIVKDVARELRYRPNLRLAACSDPSRARRDVLFHVRLTTEERCDLWGVVGTEAPYLLLVGSNENESFRTARGYRHIATYPYLPARAFTLAGFLALAAPAEIHLVANFETRDPVADRKKRREWRKWLQRWREERRALRRRLEQQGQP